MLPPTPAIVHVRSYVVKSHVRRAEPLTTPTPAYIAPLVRFSPRIESLAAQIKMKQITPDDITRADCGLVQECLLTWWLASPRTVSLG